MTVAALEGIAPAVQAYGKCGFLCAIWLFVMYLWPLLDMVGEDMHMVLDDMLSRL
jgi:hypothetical protein